MSRREHIGVLLLDPDGRPLYPRLRAHLEDIAEPEDVELLSHARSGSSNQDRGDGRRAVSALARRFPVQRCCASDRAGSGGGGLVSAHRSIGCTRSTSNGPRSLPFVTHLPLYSLRAAATKFGEDMQVEEEGWVRISGTACGSTEICSWRAWSAARWSRAFPTAACVFRARVVGSRQNKLVLVERSALTDQRPLHHQEIHQPQGAPRARTSGSMNPFAWSR